ncbi:Notchless protein homolog 1 [Mus musculus] [Rhizoctonia solani]|uniref:Notchless protein homolog 1 [Mus musculus] n=1 Tax=Rhizoctonia solani TaxID=456999 RepID=A0A0K6G2G3_9AGAM|nr:Notchless protein homolog 1 [Mus musculus] [Rhizoctonia solani]
MEKAHEYKSRIKKRVRKIFKNDEVTTAPPDAVPENAPGGFVSGISAESRGQADGLLGLLGAVSQAASISGLEPIKSIADGLIGCIEKYKDTAEDQKEYGELRTQLESTLKELKQHLSPSLVITTSMANICRLVQKEIDHVKAKQERTVGQRFKEAETNANDVQECYKRINNHLQRLSQNANIATWIILDKLDTDIRLQKLAPSLWACYNSEKAAELKRGPCTKGTRANVLANMYQWATSRDTGNLYWINGMAGTGKTTIAYSLCQELTTKENHLLCASFFCSRSLPECRTVGRIIPSIAYQLAQCSLPFRYALSKATQENPDSHTRSPQDQFDSLIVQPFSDPKVRDAFPSHMVVVIDALDECEDATSTRLILDVLLSKSKGLPIKFVVSSRPEPIIQDQIEKNGTLIDAHVVLHELDSGEVRTDIKTYLKAELAPINPSDLVIDKLVERSGVLFIYAATVVRYVGRDNFQKSKTRLQSVLNISNQKGTVQTKEIDQLYHTILEAAVNDKWLEQVEREDIKLILHTVVCAKAPLTVKGLHGLLKLDDVERVDTALRPLRSVLHVMGVDSTVTTLHASFPDYLTNHTRSGNSNWYCDAAAHHFLLAQRCFECIRDTIPQFNICQLESSYLNDDEVADLYSRVNRFIPVELRYASLYWPPHLTATTNSSAASKLLTMLERLLKKNVLLWFEIMNLTKSISATPDELTTVNQWAARHGATHDVLSLLQDVWRFALTMVSNAVSQSTPHIYMSMLPFLPSHSPIRQHYAHRMHGMIGVDSKTLDQGDPLLARWSLMGGDCPTCSRDGTMLAIAPSGSDGVISLIDALSGRSVRNMSYTSDHRISCLAFLPDGTRIVAGTYAGFFWVSDVESGQLVQSPKAGHEKAISSITFTHNGSRVISGSEDGTIRAWDVHSGEQVQAPLEGHNGSVSSLATSSDGAIISGSDDRTVRVWGTQGGCRVLGPISEDATSVFSVAVSPNDKFIVSGSYSGVCVWDFHTGQGRILSYPQHINSDFLCSVAISPDSAYISAGFLSANIQIWSATTGEAVSTLPQTSLGYSGMVAYSSDGTRIISYSDSGVLSLYDAQSAVVTLESQPTSIGSIRSIDISPDGEHIVSGSLDYTLHVWDAISGRLVLGPLTGHTRPVHFVRYSPDGSQILSCSDDEILRQWDARTGDSLLVIEPNKFTPAPITHDFGRKLLSASYSPDSRSIVTVSPSSGICLWNSDSGEIVFGPIKSVSTAISVEFSTDGTTLIPDWDDSTVNKSSAHSGHLVHTIQPPNHVSRSAFAFSSDRSCNVVADSDTYNLRLYKPNTQTEKETPGSFKGHTDRIESVQFSPDGTRIVSGSHDNTVHIWDVQTGTSIFGPLRGHTDWVNSVAYSPNGTYVASASWDGTIRIWDTSTKLDLSPVGDWRLDEDGWVVDKQSQRLVWVPPALRDRLLSPRNTMKIPINRPFRLSFDSALIGEGWADCWMGN